MTIALRQRPLARVVAGIVRANDGAIFDPSDLSTLFQDAAGTTPVTAVEQPVGKMLDKSGNGYHASQPITASRPTLSARYNLLTKTDNLADAAWAKLNTTVSSAVYQSTIDGRLADKIVASTSLTGHEVRSAALTIPANTPYTFTARLKAAGKSWAALWFDGADSGGAYFDLVNGVVGNTTFATSATISHLGGGEYLCSVTVSLPTANPRNAAIYTCDGNGIYSFTGDGVVGTYCFYADLRIGTTTGQYQRVNTATDYDTDERYFKKYLRFDEVDDYLNLPYMGLYANGSASVVICKNESSNEPTNRMYITEGSISNSAFYSPIRVLGGVGIGGGSLSDNATVNFGFTTPLVSSTACIETAIDSGTLYKFFRNGDTKGSTPKSSSLTTTLGNTTIGIRSAGGVFDGVCSMGLYGLIITKSALTDSQRVACERYLGRKSGVQL